MTRMVVAWHWDRHESSQELFQGHFDGDLVFVVVALPVRSWPFPEFHGKCNGFSGELFASEVRLNKLSEMLGGCTSLHRIQHFAYNLPSLAWEQGANREET